MPKTYKIFLSAGETSGDNLAAKLILSLKKDTIYKYKFYGIAGINMQKAGGIKSTFPIQELSVTGYLEIIPKLLKIIYRLIQTILFIKRLKPHIVITIDAPGFNFLLAKYIKKFIKIQPRLIHYVAPTVWAYKPERAVKCAKLFDHMLVIFPFEKKYFDEVGLKCTYVGNPIINNINNLNDNQKNQIKQKYGLLDKKIITIMPGSRNNELNYLLPILKEFMEKMNDNYDHLYFIIPTLSNIEKKVKRFFTMHNVFIVKEDEMKKELTKISDLILCKSGTCVLESVAKRIPSIAFYKMNRFTAYLIKRNLRIKYVTICNIIMKKPIILELLQEEYTAENLVRESKKLLYDNNKRNKQIKEFDSFLAQFNIQDNDSINKENPSHVIAKYLKN